MVTVYSLPSCVQCESTKRYLSKHLIEFKEIDMSQDPQALERIREMGFTQAPVVEFGDEAWSGFRFDKLAQIAA
jgi:glutaredoxin-like protein NrdH